MRHYTLVEKVFGNQVVIGGKLYNDASAKICSNLKNWKSRSLSMFKVYYSINSSLVNCLLTEAQAHITNIIKIEETRNAVMLHLYKPIALSK